jgi:hypothetical protein
VAFGGEKMGERSAFSGIKIRVKPRIWMAVLAAVFFLAELMIGLYGRGFIRSYMGDVLIIPFLYCLAQILFLRKDYFLPASLFLLGILAEILQYLEAGSWLDLEKQSSWDFAGSHRRCAGCGLLWGRSRDGLCRNMDL